MNYLSEDGPRAGVVEGNTVRDAGDDILSARPGEIVGPVSEIKLLSPLLGSPKIVGVALNYHDHVAEADAETPTSPIMFAKFPNTLVGPQDPIVIPPFTTEVDYEAELGVVIGRRASAVPVEEALGHVLGYTCLNDISARDLQFADGQWVRGKTLDTFCPVGPWIVTADEIPDPQTLAVRCWVNDRILQDSSTKLMVFGVAELISFISQGITLEPGDLIATGTPGGVGFARKPPIFLKDGDVVRVEVEGIGTLENPVASRSY